MASSFTDVGFTALWTHELINYINAHMVRYPIFEFEERIHTEIIYKNKS